MPSHQPRRQMMKTLPNTDPMFAYPQNIQDLIYLLARIVERRLKEKKNRQNEATGGTSVALTGRGEADTGRTKESAYDD